VGSHYHIRPSQRGDACDHVTADGHDSREYGHRQRVRVGKFRPTAR
jgi:hypothetical protein